MVVNVHQFHFNSLDRESQTGWLFTQNVGLVACPGLECSLVNGHGGINITGTKEYQF